MVRLNPIIPSVYSQSLFNDYHLQYFSIGQLGDLKGKLYFECPPIHVRPFPVSVLLNRLYLEERVCHSILLTQSSSTGDTLLT